MRKPESKFLKMQGPEAGPVIPPLEGLRPFASTNPTYQILLSGQQAGNIIIAKQKEILQQLKDEKISHDQYDELFAPWKERFERLMKAQDDLDNDAILAIIEECKK
jgi:hypothetical protein